MANEDLSLSIGFQSGKAIKQLTADLQRELNNVQLTLNKNSSNRLTPESTKQLKANLRPTIDEQQKLKKATDSTSAATNQFSRTTEHAGRVVNNFGERIGFTAARFSAYVLPATIIYKLTQSFAAATISVRALDTELNNLTQIFDGNLSKAKEVGTAATQIATRYGQAAEEILKVTNLLAQSGDQFGGDKLIKAVDALSKTKILATFGTIEETTKGALAAINQFGLGAEDLNNILDVTNTLSKRFAVESGDFFTAVQSGGAAFSAAGGNVKEFASTVATLRQITRLSASQIGTSLNTIALRLLRPDVVKFLDDFTGGQIRDAQGNLRGINDILISIGNASKGISQEELGKVVETVSGVRQGKFFVPLLKDLSSTNSIFRQTVEAINSSSGSVNRDVLVGLEKIDVILGSVAGKFKEAFLEIAKDQDFKNFVKEMAFLGSALADVLKFATPLIPALARIGTLAAGIAAVRTVPSIIAGIRSVNAGGGGISSSGFAESQGLDVLTESQIIGRSTKNSLRNITDINRQARALKKVQATAKVLNSLQQVGNTNAPATRNDVLTSLGIASGGAVKASPVPLSNSLRVLSGSFNVPSSQSIVSPLELSNLQFKRSKIGIGPANSINPTSSTFKLAPATPPGKNVIMRDGKIVGVMSPKFNQSSPGFFPQTGFPNVPPGGTIPIKGDYPNPQLLAETAAHISKKIVIPEQKNAIKSLVDIKDILNKSGISNAKIFRRPTVEVVTNDFASRGRPRGIGEIQRFLSGATPTGNRLPFVENIRDQQLSQDTMAKLQRGFFDKSAFGIQLQRGLLRARGLAGQARLGVRGAAPFAVGAGLSLAGASFAESQNSQIEDLLNSQGKLREDFEKIVSRNRSKSTLAGAGRGVSIGAALGSAALFIPGVGIPVGLGILGASTLAGGGIGALSGSASGKAFTTGQLLGAAGSRFSTVDRKTGARDLGATSAFITRVLRDENITGLKGNSAGFNAFPGLSTNPQALLKERENFNLLINAVTKDFSPFGINLPLGGGRGNKTIQSVIKKQLKTLDGQTFQEGVRQAAIDLASSGSFAGGRVEGSIRTRLTGELSDKLQRDNPNLSKIEAQTQASTIIAETFRLLNGNSKDFNKTLEETNRKQKQTNDELNHFDSLLRKSANTIEQFAQSFDRVTQAINLSTGNRQINTSLRGQLFGSVTGKTSGFNIPPELAESVVQNILVSSRGQSKQGINAIFDNNLAGIIPQSERAKFADILQVGRLNEAGASEILSRTAGKTFDISSVDAIRQRLGSILEDFFKAQNIQLNTPEGQALKDQVIGQATELVRTNPGQFANNPGSALSEVAQKLVSLDPVMQRVAATIGDLNSKFIEQQQKLEQELDIRQRFSQTNIQGLGVQANRISSLSSFGIGAGTTGTSLINLANGIDGNLQQAGINLRNAQFARGAVPNTGGIIGSASAANDASLKVARAQQIYNEQLDLSSQKLQILRKGFEDLTKSLQESIEANQKIGTTPIGDRLRSQLGLNNFRQIAGSNPALSRILKNVDNPAEIGLALQQGRISRSDITNAIRASSQLAGNPFFAQAESGARLFGNRSSGFRTGQTNSGALDITTFLAGLSTGSPGDIKDILDRFQTQGGAFAQGNSIEDQQLTELKLINQTLAKIANIPVPNSSVVPRSSSVLPQSSPSTRNTEDGRKNTLSDRSQDRVLQESRLADLLAGQLSGVWQDIVQKQGGNVSKEATDLGKAISALSKIDEVLSKAKGTADIKFDGNFNFTGFEAVARDQVAYAAVNAIMDEFIKQLRTGTVQEQLLANKLTIAKKSLESSVRNNK